MKRPVKAFFSALLAASLFLTGLSGCGGSAPDVSSSGRESSLVLPEPSLPEEESSLPEESSEPEPAGPINPLTGEADYPESAVGKRPVTVMVNNIDAAVPHRGLSAADVIYEVVVEGGITRMMAVFADPDAVPYTGPVRSVRHYYTDFAYPYDPIFVHFGGSKPGKAAVADRGLDNVDGLIYGTTVFYKDQERANSRGVEHSYFINSDGIQTVCEKRGYSLEGTPIPPLTISQTPVELTEKCSSVYVKFSGYSSDQFNFNPETGLYEKLRKGQPHIDADTGEVLTFANVLVLSTTITSYNGGDLRDVALDSGKGWFFTNGGVAPITWSKGSYKNQFTFTLSDGSPVKGNIGPTFIALIDSSMEESMKLDPEE